MRKPLRRNHTLRLLPAGIGLCAWLWWPASLSAQDTGLDRLEQEESQDYFRKWLSEDVLYIVSDEEKEVFSRLATAEEKEQFIEQFWLRRDPDPSTAANEFKEEHYRRIAYANERFSVGMPGWMSDRGRIYIIHGPPAQIEAHPTGGQHGRPSWEGGGWTQTYPWEVWRYRDIEGVGSNIELEFVDRSLSGQYKLALNPEEKDALLQMGRSGATMAEILRLSSKGDRPYFNPLNRGGYQRLQDTPFERYIRFAKVQSAPPVKYHDLREVVNVQVTYNPLPFEARLDYFRVDDDQVLIPVTVELHDRDLSFVAEGEYLSADVAVYGIVTTITNHVVQEFEDELVTSYRSQGEAPGTRGRSLYQKVILLEEKARCKLDLVLKDLSSGRVGVVRKALSPPQFNGSGLEVSSLLLSDSIYLLDEIPQEQIMFVLGDVKIHPKPTGEFSLGRPLGIYFQVYNAAIDQVRDAPRLRLKYRVSSKDRTVLELTDESGEAIQYFSSDRIVLLYELPFDGLEPGQYRLELEIEDLIGHQSVSVQTPFELTP